jgi:hypothetical protein
MSLNDSACSHPQTPKREKIVEAARTARSPLAGVFDWDASEQGCLERAADLART